MLDTHSLAREERVCKALQARLIEVEGRGCPAIVVVAVDVQYLGGAVSVGSNVIIAGESTQQHHTFKPSTDSSPLMIHSFSPVPSTMAS